MDTENENRAKYLIIRDGGSYFGAGGHTAGYVIREGKVRETVLGYCDNGCSQGAYLKLEAENEKARVLVWDYDFVNGRRETGLNGYFILDSSSDDVYATPYRDFQTISEKIAKDITRIIERASEPIYALRAYIYDILNDEDAEAWGQGRLTSATEVITKTLGQYGYKLQIQKTDIKYTDKLFNVAVLEGKQQNEQ